MYIYIYIYSIWCCMTPTFLYSQWEFNMQGKESSPACLEGGHRRRATVAEQKIIHIFSSNNMILQTIYNI